MSSFTVESWIWYAVTICMVAGRFVSRTWHLRSVRKLMVEDWFMLFLTCLFTILIVFLNIDHDVSTNLIDPNDHVELTPEEIDRRTWGSKTVLLVEQCMCAVQWGCKGCMLILYWRLTMNLRQHLAVKLAAVYVGVTYCVMIILYFGVWCRPFSDYWETPTDNVQCTTALNHLITNLVFNLTSDVWIMAIPIPLLLKQHIVWQKKLLMVFPFSLGFFTMVCAILSKYSSFTNPFSVAWVYWYCREASTIMIVSNLPYAWSLMRKVFKLRSFFGDSNQEEIHGGYGAREYRGQSLARSGTLPPSSSGANLSRIKSFLFGQRSGRHATLNSSENEMVSRTRSRGATSGEGGGGVVPMAMDKEAMGIDSGHHHHPSSCDTSMAGSLQAPRSPAAHSASHAVDRLYNLDDVELTRPDPVMVKRQYDG